MVRLDALRLEAQQMATESGYPIAAAPEVFYDGHIARKLAQRLDLPATVDFAATAHGRDPSELQAMAILVHTQPRHLAGDVSTHPKLYNGKLRFPYIRLMALGYDENFNLRHELHHPFQEMSTPMYNRPAAAATIRGISGLATAASACLIAKGYVDQSGGEALAGLVASTVFVFPTINPWCISPREWGANIFAIRTREFKPFRL